MVHSGSDLLNTSLNELGYLYDEELDNLNEDRGDQFATNRLIPALDYIAGTGRRRLIQRLAEAEDKSFFRETNTELARLACDFAIIDGGYTRSDYEGCPQAEPRFLQCLDAMENATPLPDDNDAIPATIYIDQDYVPIAFRKNWGERSTLLLKPSPHIPNVPAGTIIGTSYKSGTWPYLGAKPDADEIIKSDSNPQVSIAFVEKPHQVSVVRPSVFALDPEFVFGVEYDPTNNIGHEALLIYAPNIALTSLADIVRRVDHIAASVDV